MRSEKELRPYQVHGVEHVVSHPEAGLFLQVGLGKTVTTLTAINRLMYDEYAIGKVLLIAPKRVAQTVWHTEAQEWEHLQHLTFSLVLGDERKRKLALKSNADIYVTNRENVAWLFSYLGGAGSFDMLVIDELSSFKSNASVRFKALRAVRPSFKRVVGLTGTPMPNGLLDLWPQMYLLDMGQRLGKTIGGYRDRYFKPGKRNGHVIYSYDLAKPDDADVFGDDVNRAEIYNKISDICISMKAEDYLDLPKRIDLLDRIAMPTDMLKAYNEFEKTQVLALLDSLDGAEITAANAASLTGKLLQFANGAIYTGEPTSGQREFHEVHNLKIEALGEALEAANGEPMLIFYQFQSDVVRIQKHLKEFKLHVLDKKETLRDVNAWNARKMTGLICHAASAGHGLNLQHGGHLIYWFGRPWSLELYEQGIGRLDRSGQTVPVVNKSGVIAGTMDVDVVDSHVLKANGQNGAMNALKARIEKYTKNLTFA